jgi:hypothetical protein
MQHVKGASTMNAEPVVEAKAQIIKGIVNAML